MVVHTRPGTRLWNRLSIGFWLAPGLVLVLLLSGCAATSPDALEQLLAPSGLPEAVARQAPTVDPGALEQEIHRLVNADLRAAFFHLLFIQTFIQFQTEVETHKMSRSRTGKVRGELAHVKEADFGNGFRFPRLAALTVTGRSPATVNSAFGELVNGLTLCLLFLPQKDNHADTDHKDHVQAQQYQ